MSLNQEVDVVRRHIGPTVPKWQLGFLMAGLRRAKGVDQADVAKHLGVSDSTIGNQESGKVGMTKSTMTLLLDYYGVRDETERERYFELQRLSKTRGWWSSYGKLPAPFTEFLGIESAAELIDSFELAMVPGLLQTGAYARAHERAITPTQTNEQLERQVELRLERQNQILEVDDPPELWVVMDESILHRVTGGPKVMKEQLEHIINRVEDQKCGLQIVPFTAGDYAGTMGTLSIYTFDGELHSPIAFVESQGGTLVMEEPAELGRCSTAYHYIRSTALSPKDSVKMLKERVQSL